MTRKRTYPDAASFLLYENCNLRCTYCFEQNRKSIVMSNDVIKRGLELLCEGAKKNGKNTFHAMIFGGEPMMVPDTLEYLLKTGCEIAEKNKIRFTAGIITNATILTPDHIAILTEYRDKCNLTCQLSVDGIQKVQDKYRITASGEGSFELVENNIPIFKRIYKNRPELLNIHGCLNRFSLPYLYESYKFFLEEWGLNRIWFMPVHEEDWQLEDVEIYKDQLEKIAKDLIDRAKLADTKEQALNIIREYAPIDRCLRPWKAPSKPCGAGSGFITFTANGEIYPCHHLYFNDPTKETLVGDVWNGIDEAKLRIYQDYDMSDLTCDKDCNSPHCYRCIAVNYVHNGSIISQLKKNYCLLSRVESQLQQNMQKELNSMGLLNNNVNINKAVETWVKDGIKYTKYDLGNGEVKIVDQAIEKECDCKKECGCSETEDKIKILADGLKKVIEEINQLKGKK